jgi:hypothetical protein
MVYTESRCGVNDQNYVSVRTIRILFRGMNTA